MPTTTLYTLEASNITISGGASLSGITQGDASQLMGQTITLGVGPWVPVDVFDDDANFNDSENGQILDGAQTYDGVSYSGGQRVEAEYTVVVQDPDGNTYTVIGFNINEPGGGVSYGTVEGLAFIGPVGGFPPQGVTLTVISTSEGPGGAATPYSSYATPACFTAGTLIETDGGPTDVAALQNGDLVQTLDDGLQAVAWVCRTHLSRDDLWDQPRLRPIYIAKGALGPDEPARDMMVSPMHRVMKTSSRAELLFGSQDVLIPARHLARPPGIMQVLPKAGVTYIHIAFDRHQIVQSDGIWSESFLPGTQALSGFDQFVRAEFEAIFGTDTAQAARPCLKRHEVAVLLAA